MRKTTELLIALFFIAASPSMVFGQETAIDAFKAKYPKMGGELKPEEGKKVEPTSIASYRSEYARMKEGIGEIEKSENGGATKENLSIFDYSLLKSLQKKKQLAELKRLLGKSRFDLKVMLKDQTKYGVDSLDALTHISMMMDLVKQKDYETAYKPWSYLFNFYPIASKNVYIKAEKILIAKYKATTKKAKEINKKYKTSKSPDDLAEVKRLLAEKHVWIDTLFMAYDQRIKYYGNAKKKGKGYVLIQKGISMYKYRKKDTLEVAYKVLGEGIDMEQKLSKLTALQYYMKMSSKLFKLKKHDAAVVVADYTKMSDLLVVIKKDYETRIEKYKKKGKAKKQAKYEKQLKKLLTVEDDVTQEFIQSGAGKCEHLIPAFTPKYEANPTDLKLLKKISGILVKQKCTDSELFEKVAISLYQQEPSSTSAYMIAQLQLKKEPVDYDKVAKYYKEACDQVKDTAEASKYFYGAAVVANKRGKKSEARKLARKAISFDPKMGKAYLLIGALYGSTSGCGSNAYESSFVNSAAIDKLNKAISVDPSIKSSASKLIGQYRSRLPQKSEVFMQNQKVGAKKKVGCWIGETTVIRTRD